ncbi:MAG TPA: peptide-methionine (S)-S-oxide reductase MsrA, partial [Trueperaceae bacterium]
MLSIGANKQRMPRAEDALPGRAQALAVTNRHFVNGTPFMDAWRDMAEAHFAMGCFWGAERLFWSQPGVVTTAVGYAGGLTPNPTYREVCSGLTGHTEAVRVVYDPKQTAFEALLKVFWEAHDPTQGMRQGNDVGTQYRSAIHCNDAAQHAAALASRDAYQQRLREAGRGVVSTEIVHPAPPFYYAEDEHQQYLAKNPGGYCGLRGTGVSCAPARGA